MSDFIFDVIIFYYRPFADSFANFSLEFSCRNNLLQMLAKYLTGVYLNDSHLRCQNPLEFMTFSESFLIHSGPFSKIFYRTKKLHGWNYNNNSDLLMTTLEPVCC